MGEITIGQAANLLFDCIRQRATGAFAALRLMPSSTKRVVLARRPWALEPIDHLLEL
jgi:hypothetical protein